jgi:uncharacterized membrane protein YeaQ/YmgE (transglycosylase-associated protein family)
MSLIDLLILLIIAGICGSIGQSIVGYSHGGCIVSIAVGFIGALVGEWIARKLVLPDFLVIHVGGSNFPVVWSILGSVVFTGVISLFFKGRRK